MGRRYETVGAELERLGFDVQATKRGHWKVSRNGKVLVVFGSKDDDQRGWLNARSTLQRVLGIKLDRLGRVV